MFPGAMVPQGSATPDRYSWMTPPLPGRFQETLWLSELPFLSPISGLMSCLGYRMVEDLGSGQAIQAKGIFITRVWEQPSQKAAESAPNAETAPGTVCPAPGARGSLGRSVGSSSSDRVFPTRGGEVQASSPKGDNDGGSREMLHN